MVTSEEARRSARELEWHGAMNREIYTPAVVAQRDAVADAARDYAWPVLLEYLERMPGFVNAWRIGGASFYAPLHQAAHGGAPPEVVERLLALGAWRTLPTSTRELPVDLARERRRDHLVALLEPRAVRCIDAQTLERVQGHFHTLIQSRVAPLKNVGKLRLPELAPLTEYASAKCSFAIPGMYGGFAFWFTEDPRPTLVAESWSRVVEGSGQRHEITAQGARLVDSGFV